MAEVLAALRSLMAAHFPPLDALIVPSEDYHQSKFVSERDKRRAFVSGFTGSQGLALITKVEARLWTDSRYFLQAEQQLSDQWKLMRIGEDPAVDVWMADNLPRGAAVGVDPWCVSVATAEKWEHAFAKKQQKLVRTTTNLVDKLANESARGIIITALDEVAWLYNIRGSDVPYCPVVHAYAIVTSNSALLYVDKKKVSSQVKSSLEEIGVEVRDYGAVSSDVVLLASNRLGTLSALKKFHEVLKDGGIVSGETVINRKATSAAATVTPGPCKSLKEPSRAGRVKNANIRDGAAVVQFLAWLDKQMKESYWAPGYFSEVVGANKTKHQETIKLTEVTVSEKLEGFRASKEHFRGLSFPTISSVGPNAAISHYLPQAETCAELDSDSIYLFDSGAQYLDGTTDITRTVHFGKPSAHEKACYTAVLKGHIALGNARFPNGTIGQTLDILARIPLWKDGLDYRHGTGHGVGSYLYVHEGPQVISFRPRTPNVPLQASMTITDEPGYYEDGNFGIRLENVLIVKEAGTKFNFGNKGYLSFEHITWAPYQSKLIELSLLTPEEIEWLNSYHAKCRDILAPFMNENEMAWLKKATEPVSAYGGGTWVFPRMWPCIIL
ncbi:hypothetical protein SLE2022_303090 [Rubroshorea leprosula]